MGYVLTELLEQVEVAEHGLTVDEHVKDTQIRLPGVCLGKAQSDLVMAVGHIELVAGVRGKGRPVAIGAEEHVVTRA